MRREAAARCGARSRRPAAARGPAPAKGSAAPRARPGFAKASAAGPRSGVTLAMACRAARAGFDVVLLFQLPADLELIALRLVGHAGDLVAGAQELLWITVALQAPAHGQRLRFLHLRHLVDAAMAGDAADALLHVDRVVEVDEVRQLVHLVPDDGAVGEVALAHRRELRALVPDLFVAVEADRSWRHARGRRLLHQVVAVAAIDAFVADVVPVIELHRLIDRVLLLRIERSSHVDHRTGDQPSVAHPR